MNGQDKASHARALVSNPGPNRKQWVQVFPKGEFRGRDGRGPYRCDPDKVRSRTLSHFGSADIPTDYDHQLEHATRNGRPAPASGWVRDLAARDDGLWALVEWTPKAAAHIADREYRYVSPVFYHSRQGGDISLLESISLTNLPNLDMRAIASSEGPGATPTVEESMSLKALCSIFGLSEDSTDEQVLAHAKHLTAEHSLTKAEAAKNDAEIDGLKKALAAKETESPDPARYVPIGVFQATTAELAEMKAKAAKEEAASLAAEGVKAGKISPAMTDWAKEYASKDPEGFRSYLAQAPALVSASSGSGAAGKAAAAAMPPEDGASPGKLDAIEKAVCRASGLSEEDYIKTRDGEKDGE